MVPTASSSAARSDSKWCCRIQKANELFVPKSHLLCTHRGQARGLRDKRTGTDPVLDLKKDSVNATNTLKRGCSWSGFSRSGSGGTADNGEGNPYPENPGSRLHRATHCLPAGSSASRSVVLIVGLQFRCETHIKIDRGGLQNASEKSEFCTHWSEASC